MAHWKIFDTKEDLMKIFSVGEEKLSNERLTELAFFRIVRTNEMVQKQEKEIDALLRKHPVNKNVLARLKKEFGL